MALIVNDRVRESTTVTGTGTATLLGAIAGYQAFSVIGNGNTCYYTISDQLGANWEVGIGTYTLSGTTLARTTVLKSSNANALVSFTAGTKDVFVTYPAETSVSGGGGGTYPTIQPTLNLDFANTKLLDPRITFVRNSTAAYYDGQTTAMAEQNLLTYSQDFSNAVWFKSNSTVTANSIIAPDGTLTASTISAQAVSSVYYRQAIAPTSGANYTASRYVKSGTSIFCTIGLNGLPDAFFDLTNLTYSFTGANTVSASIVDVGNGWRRISATWLANAGATQLYLAMASSLSSSVSLTVGDTLYYWGAQLEQRSSATAYTPTTTAAITNYIPVLMTAPAGVARFDCDPITRNSLGLLIEESRTNLLTYSSDFSNAAWSKANALVTNNVAIAPDGTLTGGKLIADNVNTDHSLRPPGESYSGARTLSIYAKAGEYSSIILNIGGPSVTAATFNLALGTIVTTGVNATSAMIPIGSGWYRCSISYIAAGTANPQYYVSNGTSVFVGDNVSGIYIWGAQLEAGSFATSYIPTVASTVTRAADQASMTGTNFSSWYNQSEGTILTEYKGNNNAPTASNYGIVAFGPGAYNAANSMTTFINTGGIVVNYNLSGTASSPTAATRTTVGKVCSSYSSTTISLTNNAGAVTTSATGSSVGGITSMSVGYSTLGLLNGHIRKLSYYPEALSSSNLVALTS